MRFVDSRRSGARFGPRPAVDDRRRTAAQERVVAMLRLGGFAFSSDQADAEREARAALDGWAADGLPFATDASGARRFDPVEVVCFLKRRGLDGQDPFFERRWAATGRRLVESLAQAQDAQIEFSLRRRFAIHTPAGERLRLRAPAPLESVHGPGAVARAEAAGLDEARVEAGDGRLEIRGVSRGLGVAELAATYLLSREAAPSADPPQPAHLAPREGLVCVDAQVAELARRLAGTPARPEAALKAFWSYMLDELCCGPVPYEQIDPRAPCDFVLRSGWYDCQLGAALFVALCRAVGVPARVVGGHVLYQKAPTNHFWAEAWLEGRWAPFDFLCFDLSLGGRDMAWRERFFGRLDARLIAERRPLEFTGAPGVRIPPVWRVLQTPEPDGARMELEGVDGAPVLSDLVSVRPAP